jgi:hypothetical protein
MRKNKNMEDKHRITLQIEALKKYPDRYKNLESFALSQLTEVQKASPTCTSFLNLKIREIISKYK